MTEYDPQKHLDELWLSIEAMPDRLVAARLHNFHKMADDESEPTLPTEVVAYLRASAALFGVSMRRRQAQVRELNRLLVSDVEGSWSSPPRWDDDPDQVAIDPDSPKPAA